jgi:putative ABC transport system permease protein
MNELKLIVEHLAFFRMRSILLLLTVTLGFSLFGILGALHYSLNSGAASVSERRLIVAHEAGVMQALPLAHRERLSKLPGVQAVSQATWQGLYYREQRDMLMSFAVEPAGWLDSHPDMVMTPQVRAAFLADRRGILVSEGLARKYGWKAGDAVPLGSILFRPPSGEQAWVYIVSGTFVPAIEGGGRNYAITHYDYLNENRDLWRDTASTFVVAPAPGVGAAALAQRIDELFAPSEAPTSTATDRAFHNEFFAQFGDVVSMIRIVIGVTFLSLLLIVTSGMALSTRQRSREIGVLRVLGYSNGRVYRLIIGQTVVLILGGAVLGLLAAFLFNWRMTAAYPEFLPAITLELPIILQAGVIVLAMAAVTVVMPALIALRVKPVDAFQMEQA